MATRFLLLLMLGCWTSQAAARPAASSKREGKRAMPASTAGALLLQAKDYKAARELYRKAHRANPRAAEPRINLALCLWKTGQTEAALKLLTPMILRPGAPPRALALMAQIHQGEQRFNEAAAHLERLVAMTPRDLKARLELANCYRQMAMAGDLAARGKALTLLQKLQDLTDDPAIQSAAQEGTLMLQYGELGRRILAAKASLAAGNEVKALQQLEGMLKSNPQLPYLHYLRGLALLSPALDDQAAALKALARAPKSYQAAFQMALLHYEQGDLELATAKLRRALKLNPNHQQSYYYLGLVHQELGQDKKAVTAWKRAIALKPRTPVARWARSKLEVISGKIRTLLPGQVIDPATEIQIGKRTCEMIEKRWPVLKDPRREARLTRIMNRLLRHSDRPKRDLRYRIAVINVPVANAITVPSGKIYLFGGLIDLIRTRLGDKDEYYAAVIAHELAHNALRHGTGMIKMASTQQAFNSYLQLARLMSALSRTHEFEADQYGALYAYRAGYNPLAAIRLHRKMLQQQGEIPPGMTHPQHRERIERLQDYLLQLRAKGRYFQRGLRAVGHFEIFLGIFPDSSSARNNLAVALHRQALLRARSGPIFRRSTDIDPLAKMKVIRLHSTAEDRRRRKIDRALLREAVAEYVMVLERDRDYAPALNNLATALSDLGKHRRALGLLQRAIKRRPTYLQAMNNLGVVYAQLRRYRQATVALQSTLARDPQFALAHFNLALVHEKTSNRVAAKQAWSAYLALDSTSGWATVARTRRDAL